MWSILVEWHTEGVTMIEQALEEEEYDESL
jgi:hypothetical protein